VAVRERAPLRRVKELAEYVQWLEWLPRFFYCRAGLTPEMARDGHWPLYVNALAINDVVFAGLVAEAGYLTTKSPARGIRRLGAAALGGQWVHQLHRG